jgi:Holliday junction resolvasome RuvABC endonuclease subunit
MTKIIGLDLSLTSTGVALPDGTTVTIRPRHVDPRGRRLNDLAGQLTTLLGKWTPQVAILEGYAPSGRRFWVSFAYRAEWTGLALTLLQRYRVAVVEVGPGKLKKYATGRGDADKDQMVAAAHAAGGTPANDDEADAYLLRAFGRLVIDGHDLFGQPDDEARRLHLAGDLWWPTLDELTRAG